MLAIAPLIIVVVEIAGFFLGKHQTVLDHLYGYISGTAGPSAAHGIESIVTSTFSKRRAGLLPRIAAWSVFVVAAVGLFSSLQQALNTVWDITPAKRTLLEIVKDRSLSFVTVIGAAILLLVSLKLSSLLAVADEALAHSFPAWLLLAKALDAALSLAVATALFALLFEVLPERRVAWRDVWIGAGVSGALFVVGRLLLRWYFSRAAISSGYGEFGAILVFLIWVNYSAQIMLFGAELTHVFASRYGTLRSARVPAPRPPR